MESKRYFRIKKGTDIRWAYTHKIGGIYLATTIMDGSVWLADEYSSIPYYRYELEEVFDYGK